jgi:hypothetical protein
MDIDYNNLTQKFDHLPDGYVLCTHIHQLYKLKPRKRIKKEGNIILDEGRIVFLFSETAKVYYKRQLSSSIPDYILETYIKLRLLYYKP